MSRRTSSSSSRDGGSRWHGGGGGRQSDHQHSSSGRHGGSDYAMTIEKRGMAIEKRASQAHATAFGRPLPMPTGLNPADHPLSCVWKWWYDSRKNFKNPVDNAAAYENSLNELGAVRTVEEFWAHFDHLVLPYDLPIAANFHVFRADIKPMWEDPMNKNGGAWVMTYNSGPVSANAQVPFNQHWLKLLMSLFGNELDPESYVCGMVASRRKNNRISVWVTNARDKMAAMTLGKRLVQLLTEKSPNLSYSMDFTAHQGKQSLLKRQDILPIMNDPNYVGLPSK